jgi:hypothetical protein
LGRAVSDFLSVLLFIHRPHEIAAMTRMPALTRIVCRGLLLALCASVAARTAAAQVTATSGSPGAIAHIREQYAKIQREAAGYRRTTHELVDFSLEGGELHSFYRGRELRKLAAQLYGESWRGTQEFYFADGRLIFIHVVHQRYDEPLSGRVVYTIENRYYFDGGRLIRHVRTQQPATGEDLSSFDPELPVLLRDARLFAACAASTGAEPRECTAPDR